MQTTTYETFDLSALKVYLSLLESVPVPFDKTDLIEEMWFDNRSNNHAIAIYKIKDEHVLPCGTKGPYRWIPLRSILGELSCDSDLNTSERMREYITHQLLAKFDKNRVIFGDLDFRGNRFCRSEQVSIDFDNGVRYKCEVRSVVMISTDRIRIDVECQYESVVFGKPKPLQISFFANLREGKKVLYTNSLRKHHDYYECGSPLVDLSMIKRCISSLEDDYMRP